ncbi:spore germination protein [Bacillus timonensis]|nr:spore germination protein [Bacillus timonensis]
MWKQVWKNFIQKQQNNQPQVPPEQSATEDIERKEKPLSANLDESIATFHEIFSIPLNRDVKCRTFHIRALKKRAAVFYINTISDAKTIEEAILKPLLSNKDASAMIEDIVASHAIKTEMQIKKIVLEMNKGNTVMFIDGVPHAYIMDTSNFQGRSISKAEDEVVLKGPKEAFNEKVITNISLLRKKIRNENLVVESFEVGKRSHNDLFLVYVKDLANQETLENIKSRLNSLDVDAIQNLGLMEQYLEERQKSLFPTILYSERPDRAASFLEDGHIIMLMDNSPASLVVPATFWSFYHTSEEHYLRFPFGNFTRFLRILALFITLFTSPIYIAITNYHPEMVPADLLLAISATRERVPFPAFFEILIMEIAFELIREAGLRVPSPIGPTIGIVGALILGQAAVEANVISPIVIIVVALGGLSSFAVSDISLNFTVRLLRFLFLFASGLFGIYGMTALFVIGIFYMTTIKSFGVPYLAPMTPWYVSSKDTIFRKMLKDERFRPGYLQLKDSVKKVKDHVK